MIPYGRQCVDDDDIDAVVATLRGDWLTQGPAIERFERLVAERVHAEHAVAFANGTAALHGACAAADLAVGDVVATSPLSFVASANCARYVGADVALIDIDPDTLNLDTSALTPDIDALVPVHYAGLPVDLAAIDNVPAIVIEDAAHALGAWTPDGPVGNCARSTMTCFSFHPVKPVTTGEGGVVTTNDDDVATALRRFRTHGIVPQQERGGWYYEVQSVGMNYRLTDIQAALGASQLSKLDAFVARRQEIAAFYDERLTDFPIDLPPQAPPGFGHGYHLYPIRVDHRRTVYDRLRSSGIGVQVHYVPIHHHPIYEGLDAHCPHADYAYDRLLSLPMYPGITRGDLEQVITALERALD